MSDTIKCAICEEDAGHHIKPHLTQAHPDVTIEAYREQYPDAPIASVKFEKAAREKRTRDEVQANMIAKILPFSQPGSTVKKPMHEVFGLELTKDTARSGSKGSKLEPVMVPVLQALDAADQEMVPEMDQAYVIPIEVMRHSLKAILLNMPLYIWGPHGTGKTSFLEIMCAGLNWPLMRVQHSETTEEAHIVGQYVVRNGATEFQPGPLYDAMLNGWMYLADEYDFAHPSVVAVYQAVLEGKALFVKEAPPHMRLVKPHPNFRFIATGNTNGAGDQTGLYQGTKLGNAANYSRFGVTLKMPYPAAQVEAEMVRKHIGVGDGMAQKLVDFAGRIRSQYENGEITLPISPREVLRAATLGVIGGGNYQEGLQLAYSNRLDPVEQRAVNEVIQRIFGS